jgi:hypothetical protein
MTGDAAWVPWGVFYTPSAGAVSLPLILLPFDLAKTALFLLSCAVLLAGGNMLLQLVFPRWHLGYRVLLLGALMSASATRWAFLYMQTAPLIFGLLCMFVVALHRRRFTLAFITSAVALCLKVTLGLPFLGLAIVQRRYALAAAIAAAWLVVNGLGFVRLGGVDAVRGYLLNMARFEQADQVNYPDFRVVSSMARLDWPYLLNALNPDIQRSALLGTLLSAASVGWLLWQSWRCRRFADDIRTTAAFLGPVVCLSLLSVYHHHYDAISLLAPAIVYLSQPGTHDRRLVALFVMPTILFAGLHQVGNVEVLAEQLFGGGALVKLLGVATVLVTFAVSLIMLEQYVRRQASGVGRLVEQLPRTA